MQSKRRVWVQVQFQMANYGKPASSVQAKSVLWKMRLHPLNCKFTSFTFPFGLDRRYRRLAWMGVGGWYSVKELLRCCKEWQSVCFTTIYSSIFSTCCDGASLCESLSTSSSSSSYRWYGGVTEWGLINRNWMRANSIANKSNLVVCVFECN